MKRSGCPPGTRQGNDGKCYPFMKDLKSFMDYHYTGFINPNFYEQYNTKNGVSWLKKKEHPILHKKIVLKNGETVELRKSGEKLQYSDWSEKKYQRTGDGHRRKRNGDVINMSDKKIREKGLPTHDTSIVAFDKYGDAIGWASNEFGADGVWVINKFQRLGLGSQLLTELRKQFKPTRRMGQMTPGGFELVKKYYKQGGR